MRSLLKTENGSFWCVSIAYLGIHHHASYGLFIIYALVHHVKVMIIVPHYPIG